MPLDPFTTGILSALGKQLVEYVAREQSCERCGRLAWTIYKLNCCGVCLCERCGDQLDFYRTNCCGTVLCGLCLQRWYDDKSVCRFCRQTFKSGGGAMLGEQLGDSRVRRLIEQLGYKFDVTDAGDFKLLFATENNRSQLVFVNSNTETYEGREIREVWSVALKVQGLLDRELANSLLVDNAKIKLGSWRVETSDGYSFATFAVQVAAVPEAAFLNSVLSLVALKADRLESSRLGRDDF